MIICGSNMFEFVVSKNMGKKLIKKPMKGGGSMEDRNTFMSNANC